MINPPLAGEEEGHVACLKSHHGPEAGHIPTLGEFHPPSVVIISWHTRLLRNYTHFFLFCRFSFSFIFSREPRISPRPGGGVPHSPIS